MTSCRKNTLFLKQCLICVVYWQDGNIDSIVSTIDSLRQMTELHFPPQQLTHQRKEREKIRQLPAKSAKQTVLI